MPVQDINEKRDKKWSKEMDRISAKYGFTYKYIQYISQGHFDEAVKEYNKVIENYLIIRNGKDWENRFRKDLDSISPYKFKYNLMLKNINSNITNPVQLYAKRKLSDKEIKMITDDLNNGKQDNEIKLLRNKTCYLLRER
jgi:hypothetical protein